MKKIGIVGHTDSIKRIEEIVEKDFQGIELYPIETREISHINTTINYLSEHMKDFDGIIFTGKILYDIMNHSIHSQNPWVYLENDLQRVLLKAILEYKSDITQISIDSYSSEEIESIYKDIGLSPEKYNAIVSKNDIFSDTLIDDLVSFHTANYINYPNSIALTGISAVYKELKAKNIPAMMLTPNNYLIKQKLHDLIAKIKYADMAVSQIIVISIEIEASSEYDWTSENEYSTMLQKTKISEEVYKFAQSIQAAVIESEKSYLLFSTRKIVEYETKNLSELSIFKSIQKKTNCTISVGIGFGITAREAKTNALIGKNKALKMGGNQGFVVYTRSQIEKITPSKNYESSLSLSDLSFKEISEKSGVSINTIYQLKCIMDIYKKDTFTSHELSIEFNNSLRSMNRIIEKLEQAGYIQLVGKKIIGKSGRPSRILKFLI